MGHRFKLLAFGIVSVALSLPSGGIGAEGAAQKKVRYSYDPDWLKTVEVPILGGETVFDAFTEKLSDWPSKGGKGVYLRLAGNKMLDAYLIEIPPGGRLKPEKHMYEEFVYYLTGRGVTTFQQEGRRVERTEWKAGALFSPPMNVSHQHINSSKDQPARLLVVTSLPAMLGTVGSADFLGDTAFAFRDRYNAEEDYLRTNERLGVRNIKTNFVPSVKGSKLDAWDERGAGSSNMHWDMADNIMVKPHTSEIPAGYYKLAHRHRNEAIIIQLTGEGYSLIWEKPGDEKKLVRWKAGSIYAPPLYWYHQHFNVSDQPARYLAFPNSFFMSRLGVNNTEQIELKDEDKIVKEIWERETKKK